MESVTIRYALSYTTLEYLRSNLAASKLSANNFLVMSGHFEDKTDIIACGQNNQDCHVEDLSEKTSIYAVQGLAPLKALDSLVDEERLSSLPFYGFAEFNFNGLPFLIG